MKRRMSRPEPFIQLLPRDRRLAGVLWRSGAMSRSQLHRLTGVHPNLVGVTAQRLIDLGILRDAAPVVEGRGRPSAAMEVDPASRNIVGISIAPGGVEAVRLNLRGEPLAPPERIAIRSDVDTINTARKLLTQQIDHKTLAIGVSITGLIDLRNRTLLFSSALPEARDVSLAPLYESAGDVPVVLDNDQHAVAAWWLLVQRVDPREDALLVELRDGRLGASMLAGGPPNRGCVLAGNELGHTRLPVETPVCYCGHAGCLERIFSTAYLATLGVTRPLARVIAEAGADAAALAKVIDLLAYGLANAVNFLRPHRLVIINPFASPLFMDQLDRAIRPRLLPALAERVRIEGAPEPAGESVAAAWLGLAWVFHPSWSQPNGEADVETPPATVDE